MSKFAAMSGLTLQFEDTYRVQDPVTPLMKWDDLPLRQIKLCTNHTLHNLCGDCAWCPSVFHLHLVKREAPLKRRRLTKKQKVFEYESEPLEPGPVLEKPASNSMPHRNPKEDKTHSEEEKSEAKDRDHKHEPEDHETQAAERESKLLQWRRDMRRAIIWLEQLHAYNNHDEVDEMLTEVLFEQKVSEVLKLAEEMRPENK
eukprot:4752484-Amphidinium_carterae.1